MNSNNKTETGKYVKLVKFEKRLQLPMLSLSFVWLFVLIIELVNGITPALYKFGTALWTLFVFYFILRLFTATSKPTLLRKNWLFIVAILFSVLRFFPALQTFFLIRGLTVTLGMQVIWIFASADQGIRFVRRALGRRGVGYVLALTAVVLVAGAAALLHFESESNELGKIATYPDAVWWTAMQMTNIGSSYTLRTFGGKILGLTISIYSAGMFGYLTALFAALIIDREVKTPNISPAYQKELFEIRSDIAKLHALVETLKPKPRL